MIASQQGWEEGASHRTPSSHDVEGLADLLFLPDRDQVAMRQLLDDLWRRRQRYFLALSLRVSNLYPGLVDEAIGNTLATYRCAPLPDRRMLMEYPPFRAWLAQMRGVVLSDFDGQEALLRRRLGEYCRLQQSIFNRPNPAGDFSYLLQRYDVDPMISEVAPPSFDFSRPELRRPGRVESAYTLTFLADVLRSALQRIESVWPGMSTIFAGFVKIVIHLPELESRSCSAARFAGAMLLSASDDTLLAVEESLIHECGHQILYCVMEVQPLIRCDTQESFVLPWSGAKRDAYGYFHAIYIYLILALYFEAALGREARDDEAVVARFTSICGGLHKALSDFETADVFTGAGRRFFDQLAVVAREVIKRSVARSFMIRSEAKHGP